MRCSRTRWSWLVNLGLIIESVLVALVVAEVVLRMTQVGLPRSGAWSPSNPMRFDRERGRYLLPGYVGKMVAPDFMYAVRVNADGFRDQAFPRTPDEARQDLVFIGDSFFFGWGVEREHRLSEQLTVLLAERGFRDHRTWNLAQPGSGTLHARLALASLHERFSNPHVFLGFFVGNDFQDNLLRHRTVNEAGTGQQDRHAARERRRFRRALKNSRVVTVVINSLWSIPWFQRVFNRLELENERIIIYEKEDLPRQQHLYAVTETLLDDLITFCQSNKLELTVVLIPDHLQILHHDLFDGYDLLKPQRRLKQFLAGRGVAYIDLYEPFRYHPKPRTLTFEQDRHWTPQGHALSAEVIARYLEKG